MSTSFGIEYPLQRDGNSQAQRNIEALKPGYAPVEGRNVLELLYFWAQYAKVVLHYDQNGVTRDWSPFFDNNVPFQLAKIYQINPENWWNEYQLARQKTSDSAEDGLELLMGHLFAAFEQHQNWHQVLSSDVNPVSQTVKNLTETNLRFIIREYTGIFYALKQRFNLLPLQNPGIFFTAIARDIWRLEVEDAFFTDPPLLSKIGNRTTILPHLLPRLDRLAEIIYKTQIAIKNAFPASNQDLEALIAQDGYHDPMVGLMLTFLDLMREVQNDFNRLTERHLSYFYEQALLLAAKAHTPDAAHLVLELAKHVPDAHRLQEGTAFKDGKDKNKAEIIFKSVSELIVNKASVSELRTLFLAQAITPGNLTECPPPLPPANVAIGKPYIVAQATTDFPALGSGETGSALGRMGFVLASPMLRLAEGDREVTVTFSFKNQVALPVNILELLTLELTIKDAWITIANFQVLDGSKAFSIKFTLTPDIKPIEALSDTTLNPFGGVDPLMRVTFNIQKASFNTFYQQLDENDLDSISIHVAVHNVGSQLVVKNEEGLLNIKKPFQPFGTGAKNAFYISHGDFAGKNFSNLTFQLKFDAEAGSSKLGKRYLMYQPPTFQRTNATFLTALTYDNFSQISALRSNVDLFANNDDTVAVSILPATSNLPVTLDNTGIVVKLNNDPFLFDQYPVVLKRQSDAAKVFPTKVDDAYYFLKPANEIRLGSDIPNALWNIAWVEPRFPETPYNPTIESISLDYIADGVVTSFIQLLPFVDSTELVTIGKMVGSTETPARLAPYIKHEGSLYIGLKDTVKSGTVSILFQFSEYTGNPDLKLPTIQWSALTENHHWQPLQKDIDYVDDTEGFVQSGVIRFMLPANLSTEHTILPKGQHWLRAHVLNNSSAFDNLLGVHAQAVKITFAPTSANDMSRLDEVLEADKVKKFVSENASIGKINQPYPAFGGRSAENAEVFNRRISEHLRHKGRAINLWDFESLLLQEFPQVYKVKCLNHTLGLRGMSQDFEFLNGYVTLVVVPDVRQLNKRQRDQPKANQNLLKDIKNFLLPRISPFVELDVLNPRYETIHVDFKVRFFPGKDKMFYKDLLISEIKDFLSPWRSDPPTEIQFGGEMFRSSIIRFIEQRPYVDYITDFKMNNNPLLKSIQAQTARSVLAAGKVSMDFIES